MHTDQRLWFKELFQATGLGFWSCFEINVVQGVHGTLSIRKLLNGPAILRTQTLRNAGSNPSIAGSSDA